MTDRYNALTVVLEQDIREEDAAALLTAIRMLRGVREVTGHVADTDSYVANVRARHEIGRAVMAVLYPETKP